MPGWRNPWVGFALAPLAAPVLFGLALTALSLVTDKTADLASPLTWLVATLVGGAIISYPMALVLGVPL